jgi:preprotein translocase subunit YajC
MEPLIVVALTFALLWVLFIRPQQRRVRGHQALVASLAPGDTVVLTAGIYGRIVDIGPEDMTVEVAPGVELRVARQAVLRRIDDRTDEFHDTTAGHPDATGTDVETETDTDAAREPAAPEPDDRRPEAPGSPAAS